MSFENKFYLSVPIQLNVFEIEDENMIPAICGFMFTFLDNDH